MYVWLVRLVGVCGVLCCFRYVGFVYVIICYVFSGCVISVEFLSELICSMRLKFLLIRLMCWLVRLRFSCMVGCVDRNLVISGDMCVILNDSGVLIFSELCSLVLCIDIVCLVLVIFVRMCCVCM